MGSLWDSFSRLVGISDKQRRLRALENMRAQFEAAKRDNADSLEELKEKVRILERRALQKKKELDQARGEVQRITIGEIERIFRERDRVREREKIIAANLERINAALAKVEELADAQKAGVKEEQFDELALDAQEAFADLKDADRAARDLEREKYDAPETERLDVKKQLGELEGRGKSASALPPDLRKKLKELEDEEK
jgi:chromosome segregation ATPase